jgi:Xaa-Pro aminopeptidase
MADVLREKGLADGRIGCELEYLATIYAGQLQAALPKLTLEPCETLFRRARMVKSAREMQTIGTGFRGTEKALHATCITVTEGEDELSLRRRPADGILRSGAEEVAFCHINAGPNTGFPHAAPTGYRVQAGDIVKADCGGLYRGYFSNVGRTAKVGKPSAEERDIWKRLREIHHAVAVAAADEAKAVVLDLVGPARAVRDGSRERLEAALGPASPPALSLLCTPQVSRRGFLPLPSVDDFRHGLIRNCRALHQCLS